MFRDREGGISVENQKALEWFGQRDKKSLMAGIVYGQGLKGRANILQSSSETQSPSGNAPGTPDNWEFDKDAFCFGVAAGRSLEGWETDGAGMFVPPEPPRPRFVAILCNYVISGIPPVLAAIGYQGGGPLWYGYQIEFDAGTNGGAIEYADFDAAFAADYSTNPGYYYDYRIAAAPRIRGDITGARAIPTYWASDPRYADAIVAARARAVEFSENGGEWSVHGSRRYIEWIDPALLLDGAWHTLPFTLFTLINR